MLPDCSTWGTADYDMSGPSSMHGRHHLSRCELRRGIHLLCSLTLAAAFLQLVQLVGPFAHHRAPLFNELSAIIGGTQCVGHMVCELMFDDHRIET